MRVGAYETVDVNGAGAVHEVAAFARIVIRTTKIVISEMRRDAYEWGDTHRGTTTPASLYCVSSCVKYAPVTASWEYSLSACGRKSEDDTILMTSSLTNLNGYARSRCQFSRIPRVNVRSTNRERARLS